MSIVRINNLGITDGTIVNADINASAGITLAKLSGVNDAKAWVNFNGTGTVAIRGSFNVSSITDNGAGDYTINFTNALTDANYNYTTGAQQNAAGTNTTYTTKKSGGTATTSAFQIVSIVGDRSAFQDNDYISVSIFR